MKTVDIKLGDFEKKGISAPDSWSEKAIGIAARIYMTPDEYSIYDLIDRVVNRIVETGERLNYFPQVIKKEEFKYKLRDILLDQKAAFNTPVWCNVGVPHRDEQSWACIQYDTRMLTNRGLEKIGEIENLNRLFYTPNGWSDGFSWKTGTKKTINISLSNGMNITTTLDHKFVVGEALEEAQFLNNFKLEPFLGKGNWINGNDLDLSFIELTKLGYIQGDGCVSNEGWVGYFGEKDNDVRDFFGNEEGTIRSSQETGIYFGKYTSLNKAADLLGLERVSLPNRDLPKNSFTLTPEGMAAFLRGLYSANGYVLVDKKNASRISLKTTSISLAINTQRMLLALGIRSSVNSKKSKNIIWKNGEYISKKAYELNILSNEYKEKFQELIGFIHEYKNNKINTALSTTKRESRYIKIPVVINIEEMEEQEVYDFNVKDNSHVGWANGFAVHNCLILDVKDSMKSIEEGWLIESKTFQGGSGSGVNVSKIRADGEPIVGGGYGSGPISLWMRPTDSIAGVVKSGGKCLAGNQKVYTNNGPKEVKELADSNEKFIVLSYDPPAKRYKAKWASAWKSGQKEVIRITTDKGYFDLSYDHPIRLSDTTVVKTEDLVVGQSLFACSIDESEGYVRVHLRDGKKGKEKLHRLLAKDILNEKIDGMSVHHLDCNKTNNSLHNIAVLTQKEHSAIHATMQVENNSHVFQISTFSHAGIDNGMHSSGTFWSNEEKAKEFRKKKSEELLTRGDAANMQKTAVKQKMINTGFKLINLGCDISTFDSYVSARKTNIGPLGCSTKKIEEKFINQFGGYNNYIKELSNLNHRVVSIESLGIMDVYSVEVECPTLDDKTSESGHNFVIWSNASDSVYGSGIVVFNTRRAAKLICMDVDHPEIMDFIKLKAKAEKMARDLLNLDYDISMTGKDSANIPFQNANNSVRVTDKFMNAVENDLDWETTYRTTGEVAKTYKARDLWYEIAKASWDCGDPGLQFHDTTNAMNSCLNDGEIVASNPCVTADTLVSTEKGLIKIIDLINQDIKITGADGELHHMSRAWKTGTKEIFKLTTKSGFSIKLTSDHKVLTSSGDIKAKDLTSDMKIKLNRFNFGKEHLDIRIAEFIGLAVGDGCKTTDGAITITLSPEEYTMAKRIHDNLSSFKLEFSEDNLGKRKTSIHQPQKTLRITCNTKLINSISDKFAILNEKSDKKLFTDSIYSLDQESVASLLRGLFSADATVANYGQKSQYISLDSTSLILLEQVQLLLLGFGIKAKLYKNRKLAGFSLLPDGKGGQKKYPTNCLRISKAGRRLFQEHIGFLEGSKKNLQLNDMNSTISSYSEPLEDNFSSLEYIGEEDVYDLTEGSTNHFVANGLIVHNCNEYVWHNNTVCNLASINLIKYLKNDNSFDTETFLNDCKIMIIAMDILVDLSSYPTKTIEKTSKRYRTLGLGFTNLGALLMSLGIAYDSDEGRDIATSIMSAMQVAAINQSQTLGEVLGSYPALKNNVDHQASVLLKHYNSWKTKSSIYSLSQDIDEISSSEWGNVMPYSPRRNAQLSVIAPTGTISFLMDCETTGIEPVLAVNAKKDLVNGGTLDVGVDECVKAGINSIRNNTINGKTLSDQYILNSYTKIFQTSLGDNSVSPEGHVKMLAAVQPFVSGSISKTCNVPAESTIEDIENIHMLAWKLGVKNIAIFRDGSKTYQPVNQIKKEEKLTSEATNEMHKLIEAARGIKMSAEEKERQRRSFAYGNTHAENEKITRATIDDAADRLTNAQVISVTPTLDWSAITNTTNTSSHASMVISSVAIFPEPKGTVRRKPNGTRVGDTHKFNIAEDEYYLTMNYYEDGLPCEIFLRNNKHGSNIGGWVDAFSIAISFGLQHGVPIEKFIEQFRRSNFLPSGLVESDSSIKMADSPLDYVVRWIEHKLQHNKEDKRFNKNVTQLDTSTVSVVPTYVSSYSHEPDIYPSLKTNTRLRSGAPTECPFCASDDIRDTGTCFTCGTCGESIGGCA